MKQVSILTVAASIVALSACAPPAKYNWAGYESGLYDHYSNPADLDELAENLAAVIAAGEPAGRVPPGIYAEYGYTLLSQGKTKDAIVSFEREKARWPESARFMDSMITFANSGGKKIKDAEKPAEQNKLGGQPATEAKNATGV